MVKTLTVVGVSMALVSISAFAAPQKMTSQALDQVVAGCGCYDERGNNGWGNGADGTNPGSAAGPTALSKLAGDNLTGVDKINTNPTTSSGR